MHVSATIWCAITLTVPVLAQETQDVNLAQTLAAVELHNPELAMIAQERVLAGAETRVARAYPNPQLEISAGPWRSRLGAPGGTAQSVGIAQLLESPSVRETRAALADHGVTAAEAQVQTARLAIGYQARQAFYELLRRQEEEGLARENEKLLREILGRVSKRVEVGEAPRLELIRAEAEALAARNLATSAFLRAEEARGVLRRLTANALPLQFEARGALPTPSPVPPLPSLQSRVLEAHPSLAAAVAERARAGAQIDYERALRYPQPTLRLGESQDPETRQISIGIEFPLPLWNRRDGQIAKAQAVVDLAAAQFEAQRAQLLRELDSAYARMSIAQRLIETFEAGLLRSAESALQVAEAAYRFGERGFLEVLDAQRTLRSVRSDYTQARFDRNAAWLEIERLLALDPFAPGGA